MERNPDWKVFLNIFILKNYTIIKVFKIKGPSIYATDFICIKFSTSRVTLDEFTKKYVEIRTRLRERLNETYKRIVDHKRQRDEMF